MFYVLRDYAQALIMHWEIIYVKQIESDPEDGTTAKKPRKVIIAPRNLIKSSFNTNIDMQSPEPNLNLPICCHIRPSSRPPPIVCAQADEQHTKVGTMFFLQK
jgi:hypothetical protein